MTRLLICGDRDWQQVIPIQREILNHLPIEVVIEGEARGADIIARDVAHNLGIPVLRFPAQWMVYGKSAGPIRNKQMLDEGKPDLVLAFHPDITQSKGTANMVRQAQKAGIPVKIFDK